MNAIFDTGPWIALIDRSEKHHTICINWLKRFRGSLYSTEAVLTEVLYLLNFSISAQMAALNFVLNSIVTIVPLDLASFHSVKKLMKKYSDLPMDYADATLVNLAAETGILNMVTLDERDFQLYRLPQNRSFQILP